VHEAAGFSQEKSAAVASSAGKKLSMASSAVGFFGDAAAAA
jgi:hypothetical protein